MRQFGEEKEQLLRKIAELESALKNSNFSANSANSANLEERLQQSEARAMRAEEALRSALAAPPGSNAANQLPAGEGSEALAPPPPPPPPPGDTQREMRFVG